MQNTSPETARSLLPQAFWLLYFSVSEVPNTRENHCDTQAISGLNDLLVTDRATGLNDRRGAGFGDFLNAVGKREKGVRGGDSSLQRQHSFLRPDATGINAAHLPRAYPNRLAIA